MLGSLILPRVHQLELELSRQHSSSGNNTLFRPRTNHVWTLRLRDDEPRLRGGGPPRSEMVEHCVDNDLNVHFGEFQTFFNSQPI